ncbi:Site-specific recombinase XerD [Deinococcus reticulitermitis]|uniref:Site-specific recombinase XerD n=1 Tax=Deinococcus reticulitermitis TaxID=856736 RepID=A0A1H7AZM1_9DEIO|nr:tyrosine-type recombinase/integrase [Deinococcus reticulitermitis]SEJ70376.1 Site-specific recombinase XerD [Deinococcus reticulitermitis]
MTGGKARRKWGEGSYRVLPSGRWEWRISAKVGGKSRTLSGTADTEAKARAAAQRAKVDAEAGRRALNRAVTLGAHLEGWLKGRDGISDSTRRKYGDLLRLHVLPEVGALKLAAVDAATLREFYGRLREGDQARKRRALGYSSRRQIHNVLYAALGQAAADGLIPGNPAAVPGVRPTQAAREVEPVRAFTRGQAARFLAVADAEGERTGQVLAFLLLTGMRRGEVLGLRWEHVTLGGATPALRVVVQRTVSGSRVFEGPPKTRHGRRTVPLSAEAVAVLERVRARTAEEHAALYPEDPPSPYVFPSLRGGPYDPSNFTRVMKRVCAAAGVPALAVHDLRHTFASLASFGGVRVEVLSRILGHSDPAFTLRQYRHLYPEELAAVSLELPPVPQDDEEETGEALGDLLPPEAPAPASPARRKRKGLQA